MKIEKKIWPAYFEPIMQGKKNYELRLADWKCTEGDVLVLREWDPATQSYTGRQIEKEVTYVATFKVDYLFWSKEDIEKNGLMIISLK